jgi:hypothetical protein
MILTDKQMQLAIKIGKMRADSGAGRGDYLSCDRSPSGHSHVQAAIAECAMALYTGFPWRAHKPASEHKGRKVCQVPDVGPIEVKSISKAHHKLILYSTPLMESPHVRLLVNGSEVTFMGWAFGFEVWDPKHWDTSLPTPAYARQHLYKFTSLLNWCEQSNWNVKEVDYPIFAEGWKPPDL